MANRLTVIISQGQSNNPAKRQMEEDLVGALLMENGIDVTVIPHLYDLTPDGTGMLCLEGVGGDMVVLSWLFPRAARWTLDRNGIRGQEGQSLLKSADDEGEETDADKTPDNGETPDKDRVSDSREIPSRKIYCLDLRSHDTAETYLDEIRRIAAEASTAVVGLTDWINGSPAPPQMDRFLHPTNNTSVGDVGPFDGETTAKDAGSADGRPSLPIVGAGEPVRVQEDAPRRWDPGIDFSRCTNCMECIDFCLFGVYGVDQAETILVEQPDNCRKGCPACSRVCPENAIIFPQHKSPSISGSAEVVGSLKIDLSQLFGGLNGESATDAAARERDEQLLLAGRDAVGTTVGMPKRRPDNRDEPRDELDGLIDGLDGLDI